jgi:hypothetical protein
MLKIQYSLKSKKAYQTKNINNLMSNLILTFNLIVLIVASFLAIDMPLWRNW